MRADGWCVQVRLATLGTGSDYVTGKQWQLATMAQCPWHPEGGCGFCRHGTYARVKPRGTLIARWYCPTAQHTVSALPDCLASHFSGTLDAIEAQLSAVEQSSSLAEAAQELRTDIELPGALRYLSRLYRAIRAALNSIRGLEPLRFQALAPTLHDFATVLGSGCVLRALRQCMARYLPQLPTPLGFNPSRISPAWTPAGVQHRTGRDPPLAFVESARPPVTDRQTEPISR